MKTEMTSRERILTTLAHKEPDRVPIDLGGTMATGINYGAYLDLVDYLGMQEELVWDLSRSRTAQVSDAVRRRLGLDCVGVRSPAQASLRSWQEGGVEYLEDAWRVVWACPPGGHFYTIDEPFAGQPSLSDLDAFPWPDPTDPAWTAGLDEQIAEARALGDYALCLSLPVGFIHQSQFMRGYENWLIDMVLNRQFVEGLMDRVMEIQIEVIRRVLDRVGDKIDVLVYGDDIGFQTGPMVSPALYMEVLAPRQKRVFETLHAGSSAPVFYHTCGAVSGLIPQLIDMGVDILNPVQVSATGMDPTELKKRYGDRLSFWGAVDTHAVLPYGTPEEVREEVRRRVDQLAEGGGYVLAAVHNIQAGVPPANIVTMIEEGRAYGRRG